MTVAGICRRAVVGIPVDLVDEDGTLAFIRDRVGRGIAAHIVTVNAEFVVHAQHDEDFRRVLETADLATADGAGILWALRRRGNVLPRRVGGSDLIWTISEQASRLGHRIYLLGAAEGVAADVASRLEARYPGLRVAGVESGAPAPELEQEISARIRAAGADILMVAFGAPAQEMWIARNLERTGVKVAIGMGGSFDYVAGRARRAPVWMQNHGLDWLWRLMRQPRRWRRMVALPRFVQLVLAEGRSSRGEK